MSEDKELASWAEDFRAASPETRLPSPSVIEAEVRRDERRKIVDWLGQIASLTIATGVFVWVVAFTRSMLFAGFTAFVLPVLYALSGYYVYLRVDESRVRANTTRDHVARALRYRVIRDRFARVSVWALAVLTIGFWIWEPFVIMSKSERWLAEPWRLGVLVVISLTIFGSGFAWVVRTRRKAREDLARWQAISDSLQDGD